MIVFFLNVLSKCIINLAITHRTISRKIVFLKNAATVRTFNSTTQRNKQTSTITIMYRQRPESSSSFRDGDATHRSVKRF